MKNTAWIIISVLSLVLAAYALYENHTLRQQIDRNTLEKQEIKEEKEEYPLAHTMHFFQLYHNKLFYAGNAENWKLAGFYLHEVEEKMEEIVEEKVIYDGVKIHSLMGEWGTGPLENLEKAVEKKDKTLFLTEFNNLTLNCNGCHVSAGHPEIKIKEPESPVFTNQVYDLK